MISDFEPGSDRYSVTDEVPNRDMAFPDFPVIDGPYIASRIVNLDGLNRQNDFLLEVFLHIHLA